MMQYNRITPSFKSKELNLNLAFVVFQTQRIDDAGIYTIHVAFQSNANLFIVNISVIVLNL